MEGEFPFPLLVEGEWDPKTPKLKNKLIIYFQSKKSDGGDCIVQLDSSSGQKAVVRFKTEDVRQRVLQKQIHELKLDKTLLKLTVRLPPGEEGPAEKVRCVIRQETQEKHAKDEEKKDTAEPSVTEEEAEVTKDKEDPLSRSAVIGNVQELTRMFLDMLIENIHGSSSKDERGFSIEVINEIGCAVVTFSSVKDMEHFILHGPNNRMFRQKNLNVRRLEVTAKVMAENLPPDVDSDYLSLFFSKYGETEENVEMLDDEQSAIITFRDSADVSKVIKEQHFIKKHPVKVFPYYESLGVALYGADRPALKLPDAFTENIDKSVWRYLQDYPKSLELICQNMSNFFCNLDFSHPAVKITPLPSLLQQGGQTKKLLLAWKDSAAKEFAAKMSRFKTVQLKVQANAWKETESDVCQAVSNQAVTVVPTENLGILAVAGLAEDVDRISDFLKGIVDRITKRVERETCSVTEEIDLVPSIYRLLDDVEQGLLNKYPELKLTYNSQSQKVTIVGLQQEVLDSKSRILQEVVNLNRRMIEVDEPILNFLHDGDQEEFVNSLFISEGVSASFQIEGNRVQLLARAEKTLKEAELQLKTLLYHQSLSVEDPHVLGMAEWQELVANLKKSFISPVDIKISNSQQIVVSGFVDEVKRAQDQLCEFLHKNSVISKTLNGQKIVIQFVQNHEKDKWLDVVKNKVKVDFKDETISLSGPRLHVSECLSLFQSLLSSVHYCDLKVARPGARKFFKKNESMYVGSAMHQTGCLVQLVDENDTLQGSGNKGETKPSYEVQTQHGVEIAVCKADLCTYPVDAVVNAADEGLQHNGGLSLALSKAAGPQFQQDSDKVIGKRGKLKVGDAVITGAGGKLHCKHVIHAVGPRYDKSNPKRSVELLKKTVKRSLNLADGEGFHSVAIPAISSGSCNFPLDLCADAIVNAVKKHCDYEGGDTTLKKIHLVNNDDKTVKAIEAAMQKVFGSRSTTQQVIVPQSQDKRGTRNSVTSQSAKTKEGLTITLFKGNIQDATMDIIVNSVASDLALNHGAISQAILGAAGPQLQTLLNQQVTAQAKYGDVFVTDACNLKSKFVFHTVVPHWNGGKGSEQKVLERIVDECLGQAEQKQQASIVFPAFGTGQLGFPKPLVASVLLDSVLKFSKKRSSTHVQEVVLALHPKDVLTIQAFTDEFNKKFGIQSASASASSQSGFSKVTSPKTGLYESTVGGVVVQLTSGDITKETTDVIVNSSNDDFTLKAGVSKAILDAAGQNVEVECKQLGAQPNNGIIMSQPGNLGCKKIIHLSAKNDPQTIYQRVLEALQMTAQQNFTSISLPAFGTGQGGVQASQVADSMLDAVVDMVKKTPQSSLKLVRIVIFQAPMLADFHNSMQGKEGTGNLAATVQKAAVTLKQENTWSKLKSYANNLKAFLTGGLAKDAEQHKDKDFVIEGLVVNPACFHICGPSQVAVDSARQWIEKLINEEQCFETISDLMILKMSDKEQKRLKELQTKTDVSIRLEYKSTDSLGKDEGGEARITVEGLSRDVLSAASEIQAMLKRLRDEEFRRKDMEVLSDVVDWQYQQGVQYHSFNLEDNFYLEEAFNTSQPHVDVKIQGQVYKVTLPDGPAVDNRGNQLKIRRINKLEANDTLPEHWDAMTGNLLCKACQVQSGSPEYNEVLNLFKATCQNNVLKIERIQNPCFWKNYQIKKQGMEQKNGHKNNERRLFHGTSQPTIDHINHNGFNRSYAGKNAAAYGNGTYFAVNARYSASNTYSVPDAQGQKYMYLCRVLVGDFTAGRSGMIVPPAKSNTTTDLYDSVVDNPANPNMFIVFHDVQAYPEYLITFK
ncbi:poly(ADP-ribose) polymerase family member 14-related sequence 1 [Chanos chanos]|uniref:Poly [ADP-ribose] polymerase n=1 Tax=Chanos chanos TaxID=29144 RepID=A0A6J2WDF2_CHACN|nr:protein mono-ADP-ribosyltransferase PARP14-like [Chanos chanos]